MIFVTRLKGQEVAINPDLIESVEALPDTHIRLTTGDTIVVREDMHELVRRVFEHRRALISAYAIDPYRASKHPPKPEAP
jgi:flagellar protein FlbD